MIDAHDICPQKRGFGGRGGGRGGGNGGGGGGGGWNDGGGGKRFKEDKPYITFDMKSNADFEEYYRTQGIIPDGEWEPFLNTLRKQLPVTFRINGSGKFADHLRDKLQTDFFAHFSDQEILVSMKSICMHAGPWGMSHGQSGAVHMSMVVSPDPASRRCAVIACTKHFDWKNAAGNSGFYNDARSAVYGQRNLSYA